MRACLLLLILTLAPLAHAQRGGTAAVTGSYAVGLVGLLDGEGFTTHTTAVAFTGISDRGDLSGLRIGTETRTNGSGDGRAFFIMLERGQVSNPTGLGGMMLVLGGGYNSLNRHARPLGYALPTLALEAGPWVRIGPLRAEVVGGIQSFAIFNGGGFHARFAAGLQL